MFHDPSEFVAFKVCPYLPGVELYSARLIKHSFAAHAHDGYSLGAIEEGVERFRYRGSEHVVPYDNLVLLNPDELHTGQAEISAGWTYQMLYIEPETLRAMTGKEAFFPTPAIYDPQMAATFRRIFRQMWQASDDLSFISGFTQLVDAIVLRYGAGAPRPVALSCRDMRRKQSMQRVLDRIETQLDAPLPVDMLAAEAGLSTFHFIRSFTAAFHVTPHQYVQARRTLRAKSMLARHMTPSKTTAAVGLTDQSHLNRWFKRAYGVTPAQYQQQINTRPGFNLPT